MSYDDHTACGFCRRHSVDCWCYSTALRTDEAKDDQSAWCHRRDDPSAHVPAAPWGQHLDAAYEALEQAFLDAKPVEPHSRMAPDGEGIMGRISDALRMIESAPPVRAEPIKLTEQQIAAVRAESAARPEAPKYATGGPIRRGDLGPFLDEGGCSYVIPNSHDPSAEPGGILSFSRKLTDEEFQRFERRWRWSVKEQGNALRIINSDGSNGRWLGRRPSWWKRAYYRVRRWLS